MSSVKLEQDFWKTYQQHTQIEASWLGKMPKTILRSHYISDTFFQKQDHLQRQLKMLDTQLKNATYLLDEHRQNSTYQESFLKLSSIDRSRFSAAIVAFARKTLPELRQKFEEKNVELMLQAKDIRLVKELYDLKPNETQV